MRKRRTNEIAVLSLIACACVGSLHAEPKDAVVDRMSVEALSARIERLGRFPERDVTESAIVARVNGSAAMLGVFYSASGPQITLWLGPTYGHLDARLRRIATDAGWECSTYGTSTRRRFSCFREGAISDAAILARSILRDGFAVDSVEIDSEGAVDERMQLPPLGPPDDEQ